MDSEDDRKICDTIIIINIAASEEQNGEGEILEASMIETLKGGDNTTERDIDEGKLPVPARSGYPLKIRKYQFAPALVALIIILVWCLFVGFALLYHLSRSQDTPEDIANITVSNISTCSGEEYTGDICRNTLQMLQECLPAVGRGSSEIIITTQGLEQSELENNVKLFLTAGLSALSPSQMCETAVRPLLCLYSFPLCDVNGMIHLPSPEQCTTVRDEVCMNEWQTAMDFLGSEQLPQCNLLPEAIVDCRENMTVTDNNSETGSTNSSSSNTSDVLPMCSDGFYNDLQANGLCVPHCGTWLLYPPALETAMNILIIIAMVIGTTGGGVVLLLSCGDRKRALKFPSVFILYQTAIIMALDITLLVGRVGQESLYCSSSSLQQSYEQPTAYCIITAVVFYYAFWQLSICWIAHIGSMFWAVWFPFHALRYETTNRNKYIHFTVVLLALILPGIPAGVHFAADGFVFGRFPPITCIGRNSKANFYSIIFPAALADVVALSLLILIFWIVYKESRAIRHKYSMSSKKQTRAPQLKILFIVCYFCVIIIFEFAAFSAFYLAGASNTQFLENIAAYFLCESTGRQPGETCDRSGIDAEIAYQLLFDVALILFASFPAVNLIYATNVSKWKRHCMKWHFGIVGKTSTSSQLRAKDTCNSTVTSTSVTRLNN